MIEIRFYHLERDPLERVLPVLLGKALAVEKKVIVKASTDDHCQSLSQSIWSYRPDSFIPHGTERTGFSEVHPIWVTSKDENPNGADTLFLTMGAESDMIDQFSLCCEIFNGRYPDSVKAARSRWKIYKEAGHTLTYWQQGERGWEKKAG